MLTHRQTHPLYQLDIPTQIWCETKASLWAWSDHTAAKLRVGVFLAIVQLQAYSIVQLPELLMRWSLLNKIQDKQTYNIVSCSYAVSCLAPAGIYTCKKKQLLMTRMKLKGSFFHLVLFSLRLFLCALSSDSLSLYLLIPFSSSLALSHSPTSSFKPYCVLIISLLSPLSSLLSPLSSLLSPLSSLLCFQTLPALECFGFADWYSHIAWCSVQKRHFKLLVVFLLYCNSSADRTTFKRIGKIMQRLKNLFHSQPQCAPQYPQSL